MSRDHTEGGSNTQLEGYDVLEAVAAVPPVSSNKECGEFALFVACVGCACVVLYFLYECLKLIYKNLCEDIRLLSSSNLSHWDISMALFNSAIPLLPLCAAICVASIFIVSNPAGWALGALGVGVLLMAVAAVGISAGLSKLLHPNPTDEFRKSLPNSQKQVEKDVNDIPPPITPSLRSIK